MNYQPSSLVIAISKIGSRFIEKTCKMFNVQIKTKWFLKVEKSIASITYKKT